MPTELRIAEERKVSRTPRLLVDRPLFVFCAFAAAYLVTWAGHMDNGDSSFRIAWAKAMLFRHTAVITDAGLGADYCKYSIGHSLLAMPFLAASAFVERLLHVHAEGPIYMLLFILNAAVFLTLVARYLRSRFSPRETWRTLLVLAFCTAWLPCSRMDSIEQLVLTFLFGGFLAVRAGRPVAGVLIASYAIVIRPDAIIPVFLLAAWRLWSYRPYSHRLRPALMLGAALLPALALNAATNWIRWGTIREAGYAGEPFSVPFLVGLHGLLFSGGKSVFLYSPPVLLGIAALVRYVRTGRGSRDYWFFASVLIAEALLYAKWWDWSGDDHWGVRFLNPGVMLMCIPAAEFMGGLRWPKPALALAVTGLAVQSLAVLVDPMASDYVIRHYHLSRLGVWSGGESRLDLDDARFNPRYSPLATNWIMVRALFGFTPHVENDALKIERSGTPFYNVLLAAGWDPRTVECDVFWVRLLRGQAHKP